jgi:hypothetical protein
MAGCLPREIRLKRGLCAISRGGLLVAGCLLISNS